MRESYVEQRARLEVEKRGGEFNKYHGRRGDPDRIMLVPGGMLTFVELKRPGRKIPEKIQRYRHMVLRKLGFRVEVCDGWKQVVELFEEIRGV